MKLTLGAATPGDAEAVARLRNAASEDLTRRYGRGHWSSATSKRGVLRGMSTTSRVIVARGHDGIIATLRLATKKPWAIDPAYFTAARKCLYLTDMAVDPARQRTGIGRQLLEEAIPVARAWPAEAIRLDAYDADAGAGGFYATCGFREVGRVIYRKVPLIYYERLV